MSGRRYAQSSQGELFLPMPGQGGRGVIGGGAAMRVYEEQATYAAAQPSPIVTLPVEKPKRAASVKTKDVDYERGCLVADTAVRAAAALAAGWPRLPYATVRSITIHALYLEFARAAGMQVPLTGLVLEPYASAALDTFLDAIGSLPFADLTPEHFGAAHEKLTGFHTEDGRLVSNNGRRANGVHFTPRSLTQPIVSKTLEPILSLVEPARILELRVCDPSVGSGAFLLELVRQLGVRVLEAGLSSSIVEAKRLVAIHCAYGVDICRFGVASTKLALTLECRADRMPSGWLDDNVKRGDALVGLQNAQLARFHWSPDGKGKKGVELPSIPEIERVVVDAMTAGVARRKSRIDSLSALAKGAA